MMKMYDEAKNVLKCDSCGDHFGRRQIAIMQRSSCLCPNCYKRDLFTRKILESFEEAKGKTEVDDFIHFMEESEDSRDMQETEAESEENEVLSPKEIVEYLSKNIIGQDAAKKALAVAVYNHYRRVNAKEGSTRIPKSNILIKGPTGSGKTYLLKNLAKILDVPFFIADASVITEAGYRGNDAEGVLTGLYHAAGCDIEKAEKGIVYLDEFDKLSINFGHSDDKNTSNGAGVQRQILKMLEGCDVDIPKEGVRKTGDTIRLNTENILFICGGAFVGIDECKETKKATRQIGFAADNKFIKTRVDASEGKLTTDDFIKYGLIPEIVGRLPIIISLNSLSERDIRAILTDSGESIIKSYKELLREYGVELILKKDAIEEIAHQAYVRGTGARGINAIVEGVMQDLMYEIPSDTTISKCIITKGAILGTESPLIIHKTLAELEEQRSAS